MGDRNEIKKALFIVWTVITSISLITIAAPFFIEKESILDNVVICTSIKKNGAECFFCGTTRAFIAISDFNFKESYSLNKGSLILFTLFVTNTIVYISYVFVKRII